ncbi:hypothetical protein AAEU32_05975 [Pseudoalteromonas sp. SSDWG2]|uniref:hypothetical protein n=1 Tax=Pseudoalteromonas sp. SSDWG2 TaxID=3139391 RepID=UPI003BAB8011
MKIHKGDIAIEMLEDTIRMHLGGHYISSFHLAAAASELLSGLSEINGFKGAHRNLKEMMKDFHDSNPSFFSKPKDALKRFNSPKNAIKHINGENDQYVYLSPEHQSKMYIGQCQRMLEENFGMCLLGNI